MQNAIRRTIRTVTKNKVFSIINILGLAISLAIFLLMLLYLEQEWSYDRFHEKADRIYRLVDDKQTPKATLRNASTAMPVAPALLEDFPEIEAAVRILPTEMLFKKEELLFQENSVFFADANFFDVFDFEFLAGDALMSLSSINSIVLTKSSAEKYFGDSSPIGETLIADGRLLTVKGVVEDVPENAHFTFDFLISMENAKQKDSGYDWLFTNWYSGQCYTYLLLPQNYKATQLEDKLTAFDERHDEVNDKTIHHYALEALTDIYLYSDRENQIGKTGNAANIYILSLTALFILLIAGVNYVNLSTAQSTKRVLEVGIKKVLGAKPQQLFLQFISESFFVTALALVLALTLVLVSLPFISALVGSDLSQNLYTLPHFSVLLGLYSTMSFLAGIYPSSMLASYSTTKVLKEKTVFSTSNFGVKKGLVILQFSISIILMISSLVVYHQLRFMQNAKLGFDPVQTLVIDFNGDRKVQEKSTIIKRKLLNIPGVKNITASSRVPGREKPSGWSMRFLSPTGDTLKTEVPLYIVDHDFLEQYKIEMLAGRAFSTKYLVDNEETILISEATVKSLGFNNPEEVLGTKVLMYPKAAEVVGIFQDFHYESLQIPIQPLAMRIFPFGVNLFSLQLETSNLQATITAIERKWKTLAPQRPLSYTFLDEDYNKQYATETQFGQTLGLFTLFALFIANLGLFGLTLFSVQQRTKEIGTRKVLGASVLDIIKLLTQNFLKLVAIAALLATPIAWYLMNNWLQNFAYQTEIQWWTFVLVGTVVIGVALLTVSMQSMKAARANPIDSLRNE